MSKRHKLFLTIVILFNVLMCYGFVSSRISLEDFLYSEINEATTASYLFIEPFRVGVSHPTYINGTLWNLGPLPTYATDYTYVLVLASAIGNVIFSTLFVIVDVIIERKREN